MKTGKSGAYTGKGPTYAPALNASDFYIPLVAPGQSGVPPCDTSTASGNAGPGGGPLCDVYETTFVGGQRNIFRQSFQKRADMTLQKDIHFTERYNLRYQFEVFNVSNTPSFDVPTNDIQLSPNYEELANPPGGYANGTQAQPYYSNSVATPSSPKGAATCQGSSANCAYEMYTLPQNTGNELGVVTNAIGSQRLVEMSLHLMF